MQKETYNVIGVMSGTSLDGIDLAHIHFSIVEGKWGFEIHETETVSYDTNWLNKLKTAVDFSQAKLQQLNEDYTVLLAHVIKTFIKKHNLKNLDAVCSHGHTILHTKITNNGLIDEFRNLGKITNLECKSVLRLVQNGVPMGTNSVKIFQVMFFDERFDNIC